MRFMGQTEASKLYMLFGARPYVETYGSNLKNKMIIQSSKLKSELERIY